MIFTPLELNAGEDEFFIQAALLNWEESFNESTNSLCDKCDIKLFEKSDEKHGGVDEFGK